MENEETVVTKDCKMKSLLTAGVTELTEKRAERLVTVAEDESKAVVREMQSQITDLEVRIEELTDIGTSADANVKTNEPKSKEEVRKLIRELHDCEVKLSILRPQLVIAKATHEKYFG